MNIFSRNGYLFVTHPRLTYSNGKVKSYRVLSMEGDYTLPSMNDACVLYSIFGVTNLRMKRN